MASIGGARILFQAYDSVRRHFGIPTSLDEDDEKLVRNLADHRDIVFRYYPPRRIRHFITCERVLGSGGYGKVFRGIPTKLGMQRIAGLEDGKRYAVKRMKLSLPEPFDRSMVVLSAERQLRILDVMQSEACEAAFVTKCFMFLIEIPHYLFEVMELLEGPDLLDFLGTSTQTLGEDLAARLVFQMLTAVNFLHRSVGVLHRDIKPENLAFARPIPRDGDGLPSDLPPLKLFDFGLAWALPEVVTDETAHTLIELPRAGTPLYMAPEAWLGRFGPPCDIWGTGVLAHVMLTLGLPFGMPRCKSISEAVRKNALEFDDNNWADISVEGREFVSRALEKDAAKRPSASELLLSYWLTSVDQRRGPPRPRAATMPALARSRADGPSTGSMVLLPVAAGKSAVV